MKKSKGIIMGKLEKRYGIIESAQQLQHKQLFAEYLNY